MGKVKSRRPVKLIAGFIFNNEDYFNWAKKILEKRFGKVDFESQALPFVHTNYYERELGTNLKRKFVSFRKLISPSNLPKIKIFTNKIEYKLSKRSNRQINIDPGYLELSKLVLASTKDYKHRIYLGKGIFAEITLLYQDNSFRPWEWTYPDYKTHGYIQIFNKIRQIYYNQMRS